MAETLAPLKFFLRLFLIEPRKPNFSADDHIYSSASLSSKAENIATKIRAAGGGIKERRAKMWKATETKERRCRQKDRRFR